MAKQTVEEKMNKMTREELEQFRIKKIEELFSSDSNSWTMHSQEFRRYALVQLITRIEGKLRGSESAVALRKKIYDILPKYQKLTPEQKMKNREAYANLFGSSSSNVDEIRVVLKAGQQSKNKTNNYRVKER